jgi:hypothetical protein
MNLTGFHGNGWRAKGEPGRRATGFKIGIRQDILGGSHPGVQNQSNNQRGLHPEPFILATGFFSCPEERQNAWEILHWGFFHGWVRLKNLLQMVCYACTIQTAENEAISLALILFPSLMD